MSPIDRKSRVGSRRAPSIRSKTGCVPCRRRRKKCDERQPTCLGCERNHLICSWSSFHNPTEPGTAHADELDPKVEMNSVTGSLVDSPIRLDPSVLPAVFRHQASRPLFEYYNGVTAPRLVGKDGTENPFITCNIRVAQCCPALQHAILAVSACHRAYSESSFLSSSHDHYAVALRGLKVGLTKWDSCSIMNRAALLATSLTLCWYEVIDANAQGSLYHHLRANGSMIIDLQNDDRLHDSNILGFFIEQYSYLASVANFGIGFDTSHSVIEPAVLQSHLGDLNQGTPFYGFLFGYSHQLYETIPRIRQLANKAKFYGYKSSNVQQDYELLLAEIGQWKLDYETDTAFEQVGRMYQASCLIYLESSVQDTDGLSSRFSDRIQFPINQFLTNFEGLSCESPAWTTFMWATLNAGSCIRDTEQRKVLLRILQRSQLQMRAVEGTTRWISLYWEQLDQGVSAFGPFGLERVMREHDLTLCIG